MDDDVDIYADILSKVTTTPDKVHVHLEQEILQLKAALEACQREKNDLQIKNDKLSTNISSLYRTAKLEIRRKNALIEELRNQQHTRHTIQESQRCSDKESRRVPDDGKTQLNNINDRLRDDCRSHSQENRRRSDREQQDSRTHSTSNRYRDDRRSNSNENRYRSGKDHHRGSEDSHAHDTFDHRSQDKYNGKRNDHLKDERRSRSSQNEYHSKDRRCRLDHRTKDDSHPVHSEHHRSHRDPLHRPLDRRSPKDHRPNGTLISQDEQYLLEKRRMLRERLAREDQCLREQHKVDKNEKLSRENRCRRRSRPENDVVDSSLVDTPMKMFKSEFTTAFVKLISPLGATPDHIRAKFNDMIKSNAGVPTMLNDVRNDFESYSVTRTQDIKSVAIMASKIKNDNQSTVILSQNNIRLHAVEPQTEPSTVREESVPELIQSSNDAKLNAVANEVESSQSVVQLQNDLISVEHGAFKKRIKRRPVIRIVESKTNVEVESC